MNSNTNSANNQRIKLWLQLCFWTLALTGLSHCEQAPSGPEDQVVETKAPNIVWIVAEDLSPIIAAFGDSTAQTPNLDRLAAEGIRFPNTFSISGVCAPSRAALATGMYPTSIGAHNMRVQWNAENMEAVGLKLYEVVPPPEVKMMSQLLREHGYFCTNNDKTDYQFKPTITAWDENGMRAHWRHRKDKAQPFFSIFNLGITHESQVWTTGKKNLRYVEGFENPDAPTLAWSDTYAEADRPPLTVGEEVPIPPYLADTEITRRDVRRVYSNIEIMDQQVGLILDQLEADGELDNTIIFWYTDHGGPLPRQKRLVYDSGIRVPLIVRYPDQQRAGTIDSSLTSFVDFAPTVFSLAGIQPPNYLQGQAFLGPYQAETARKYVYAAADRFDAVYDHMRATRDHRYKYIRHPKPDLNYYIPVAYREQMGAMQELLRLRDAGELTDIQAQWFREQRPVEELFDTYTDPHEVNNLANNPAYADKLASLRQACDEWLATTGDMGELPESEVLTQFWGPEWEQPQTNAPYARRDSLGRFTLHSSTPGATIGYRVMPQDSNMLGWRVYTAALNRTDGDTIYARADRIGFQISELSLGY